MASADPVRIALVGAGRMGRVHLHAMRSSAAVAPAAVVEPVAALRETLSAQGLITHASVEELLEAGGFDAVLIAAPSDQHAALVASFAGAGVPILCEKPVGIRAADAQAASEAARRAGVLLQVGYWRRFVPELRDLRRRIAGGELGTVNMLASMQWDAEPPTPGFRAHSGGIAVDMGVHEFDQTRWLLGQEVSWVAAVPAGPSETEPVAPNDPDAASILLQLSGGAAATVSLGRRFPQADSCWAEVWATRGYERVPFMWAQGSEQAFVGAITAQLEGFVRAVTGGRREGAGGEDAVAALTVAEAVASALAEAHARATA
ncbi:MAG TPA: Gfo/Idh/MocA family oxidoreductase [Solirubrobacteraceae bacterium]